MRGEKALAALGPGFRVLVFAEWYIYPIGRVEPFLGANFA